MRQKTVVATCACVAAAVAAGLVLRHRGATPGSVGKMTPLEARADVRTTDEAAAAIANLESRVRAVEARAASADVAPASPPSHARVADSRRPPRQGPTTQDMDVMVQSQARDRSWAAAYERDVRGALETSFASSHVREVSCATSLCRIVVEHPSPAEESTFRREVAFTLPDGYASFHIEPQLAPDGTRSTVLHVIRAGHVEDVLGGT